MTETLYVLILVGFAKTTVLDALLAHGTEQVCQDTEVICVCFFHTCRGAAN